MSEHNYDKRVVEELADYAHEAWSGWMVYLGDKSISHPDGSKTIPAEYVDRWRRQVSATYDELPENEKESDRAEARKILSRLEAYGYG